MAPHAESNERTARKLRIGWFSFSCCEDSTIVFTELLNDHWQEWKNILDIRHARVLQSHNVLDEMDVAFVEGALASKEQVEKVQEIRFKAKKLVAIGSCACIGLPSAQRDQFGVELLEEIHPVMQRFAYMPHVEKLANVVQVDAAVPGCPMDEKKFLTVLESLLNEFGIYP